MKKKISYLLILFITLFVLVSCADTSPSNHDLENIQTATLPPKPTAEPMSNITPTPDKRTKEPVFNTETPTEISTHSATQEQPSAATQAPATNSPTIETVAPHTLPPYEPYDINVTFSHPSGFYNNEILLKLSYNKDVEIRYTTDGSMPTYKSQQYKSPVIVADHSSLSGEDESMTIIRAAAFEGENCVSNVTTNTYLINKGYSKFNNRYGKMAVISIATDVTNLYGSTGIFTNFAEHGRETERPVHIEFFDTNGILGFSVDAGMRVYGGTSRGNPQKSLKLVARKEYDAENGKFKYPIFPNRTNISGKTIDRYDSFILRAGGNDNLFGGTRSTFLRDALVHSLALPITNIAQQAYRPAVVYINGDYFGIYNIRDDLDNDYIEQHFEIPKDEVAIIAYGHENGQWFYKIDEGTDADLTNYKNTLAYIINHNMKNKEYYNKASKMLDFDNFIKYIGINVYSNNRDWPHNNVRAWCHNGKWHFMLKDIDYSWGIYHIPGAAENVVAEETAHSRNVLTGREGGDISRAFASLMKNPEFKKQFLSFMDEMMNNYFSTKTAHALINEMVKNMQPEYNRYSTTYWYTNPLDRSAPRYKLGVTEAVWKNATRTLYEYATKRPEVIKNLLDELYS